MRPLNHVHTPGILSGGTPHVIPSFQAQGTNQNLLFPHFGGFHPSPHLTWITRYIYHGGWTLGDPGVDARVGWGSKTICSLVRDSKMWNHTWVLELRKTYLMNLRSQTPSVAYQTWMNIPPDRIHLVGVPELKSKIFDHLLLSLWKKSKSFWTGV